MFDRGIGDDLVEALKKWPRWKDIVSDRDLFVGTRKDYINIYYQGCSLFKISYKDEQLVFETHYKYLINPTMKQPLVSWHDGSPDFGGRESDVLIHKFEMNLLKKSASSYARAEKKGVHCILKSNRNIVDVEIAISPELEIEAGNEDQDPDERRVADRIDFAALQKRDGKPCIVFFEAKRFDNAELRSWKSEPRVFEQIRKYEKFIRNNETEMETSYRRVCENLINTAPDRYSSMAAVMRSPEAMKIDPEVRLVIFGFDKDQQAGKIWTKYKEILQKHFKSRLLLIGNPRGFTRGISDTSLKDAA